MQADNKEIYRLTSEKTGIPESVYKDLGTFIFNKLYGQMRKPKSLILKLKGVGSWHLRKMRIKHFVETHEFTDILGKEDKKEIHDIFKERLKDYDKYIEKRNRIREVRWKTQKPI